MVIRCERCSTLYELDEALLAPEGSQVQCTRCDHVFTVRPPRTDQAEERAAAVEPVAPSAPVATPPPAVVESIPPPEALAEDELAVSPPRPASGPRPPAHEPRYARGAAPSVYRPTPGPGTVRAHPVLRRDTVGAFESRLRSTARLRMLVPVAAVLVVALAVGGWFLLRSRGAPSAASAPGEGLSRAPAPSAPAVPAAAPQPAEPPRAPPAQPPAAPLPGNAGSPAEKSVAQGSPAAASSEVAPRAPIAEGTPQPGAVAAPQPAQPATPVSAPASPPTSARGAPASALLPAALPDVAPASGMPQIAPSGVPEGTHPAMREPAALEDTGSGG